MATAPEADAEVPVSCEQDGNEDEQKEEEESTDLSAKNRQKRLKDAMKSKLFESMDKDGSYFSYLFLEKIFGETRKCTFCGATGSGKLPKNDDSLELYVTETGLVGRQNIECLACGKIETITSCEKATDVPRDKRLAIQGLEVRDYCKKITHFEVLHDLMEMLHIASTEDDKLRREKHSEVAGFMMQNARKVCEEWCKAEYAELRLKKYLRLREETLLTTYKPTFMPDSTEEYMEMYRMMADSFCQNRDKVLLLLELLKESLIDYPTRSSFMMWVSIAMMHSENYPQFKVMYDPRSFMRVDSSEYQALQDRYLALNVPLGIKKIPVVFILFEIPRFYHYVDFLNRRLGKKKFRRFLTREDRALLVTIAEENERLGITRRPKTGMLVSPEAHLDFLTRREEMEREMIYRSCREKEKEKGEHDKPLSEKKLAISAAVAKREDIMASQSGEVPPHCPVVMSTDDFRSMLVEHLKANEASVASKPSVANKPASSSAKSAATSDYPVLPKYATYGTDFPAVEPGLPIPEPAPLFKPLKGAKGRKTRKQKGIKKEKLKKKVLVTQVDTELLRQQGFKVGANSTKTTVICSKDGTIEHVLEGFDTPEQVKAFLAQKYNVLSQQQGTGYISLPTCDQPGGLSLHPTVMDDSEERLEKAKQGNSKKKGRGRAKERKGNSDNGLSGFPFTSQWSDENRETFKHQLIKGIEKATGPFSEGKFLPGSTGQQEVAPSKETVEGLHSRTMSSNPGDGDGTGKEVPYTCKVDTTEFLIDPVAAAAIERKVKRNETMKSIIKEKFKTRGEYSYSSYQHDRDKMYDTRSASLVPRLSDFRWLGNVIKCEIHYIPKPIKHTKLVFLLSFAQGSGWDQLLYVITELPA